MPYAPINVLEKFAKFSEHWSPKIVAQINDYQFKLVRIQGEFVWHAHADTDEVFFVLDGEMTIHLREGAVVLRSIPATCRATSHPETACGSDDRRRLVGDPRTAPRATGPILTSRFL